MNTSSASAHLMTLADAADYAGVKSQSLYSVIKRGNMWHKTHGRTVLLRKSDVEAYKAERERRRREGIASRTPLPVFSTPEDDPMLAQNGRDAVRTAMIDPADDATQLTDAEHDTAEPPYSIWTETPIVPGGSLDWTEAPAVSPSDEMSFPAVKAALTREVGAVRHQLEGVSRQIMDLESHANTLIAQEEHLSGMIARADELEAFAREHFTREERGQ